MTVNRRMAEELPQHLTPDAIRPLPSTLVSSLGDVLLNPELYPFPISVVEEDGLPLAKASPSSSWSVGSSSFWRLD